jgi:hypothetical protein
MVAIPASNPVTIPVPDPTLAVAGSLLLHVPPLVKSASVTVLPTHSEVPPVIPAGAAFTVIALYIRQPVPSEYVIVTVPAAIPLTIPLSEPMVATAILLLLHAPPPTPSLSIVVPPTHTFDDPLIAGGAVLTFTVVVIAQPVGRV